MLRVQAIDKTKLKSNHYWIMVLLTKLHNLRVIKFQGNMGSYATPDFFKFMLKGMNYMQQEGR